MSLHEQAPVRADPRNDFAPNAILFNFIFQLQTNSVFVRPDGLALPARMIVVGKGAKIVHAYDFQLPFRIVEVDFQFVKAFHTGVVNVVGIRDDVRRLGGALRPRSPQAAACGRKTSSAPLWDDSRPARDHPTPRPPTAGRRSTDRAPVRAASPSPSDRPGTNG